MDPVALESAPPPPPPHTHKSLVDKYVIVPKNVFDYN